MAINLSKEQIVQDVSTGWVTAEPSGTPANVLSTSKNNIYIIKMNNPKDLTKNQKEQLNKLLLKQKEWEQHKKMIKKAKAKPKGKNGKA